MQLLYGNDGINFRVLDASKDVDSNIEKGILSYSRYDFVNNYEVYASIAEEPEAITYVSTNLNNAVSDRNILVSKSGHMRQYSSPSAYFHAYLKEVDSNYYRKQFFEIFQYRFIEDLAVNQYHNGSIDSYVFNSEIIEKKVLNNDQIKTILATFLSNEKSGSITKILMDVYGSAYNQRSREVLATIYRYLPYEFRKRHGFLTYTRSEKGIPARVSFVLFCPTETKQDGSYIELRNLHPQMPSSILKKYVDYATYLVDELDDNEREKHFEALSKLAINGRLTVDDCLNYYVNVGKWMKGSQEQFLTEWIDYIDKNSFRKGPLYEIMIDIIQEKVDNNYYNDYLFDHVLNLYGDRIENLSSMSSRSMRFADCIDTLHIDPLRFHQWYMKQQERSFCMVDKKDAIAYERIIATEIQKLKAINIMCKELDQLLAEEIRLLESKGSSLREDMDERMDQEAEQIGREIQSLSSYEAKDYSQFIHKIAQSIEFPDNIEILKNSVDEWVREHIPANVEELSLVKEDMMILQQLQDVMSQMLFAEYSLKLQEARSRLEQALKTTRYPLKKDNLLKTYIDITNDLNNEILDPKDKIIVSIREEEFRWNVKSLHTCLRFILLPQKEDRDLELKISKAIFVLLADLDVFDSRHFPYLLNFVLDSTSRLPLVDVVVEQFLIKSKPVRVSGYFLARELLEYDEEQARSLALQYRNMYREQGPSEVMNYVDYILDKKKSAKATKRFGFF